MIAPCQARGAIILRFSENILQGMKGNWNQMRIVRV
jgi:hypothetical protein